MTRELTLRSFDIPSIARFGVGFDSFFDDLAKFTSQPAVNYPPYNIVSHDENKYSIELAVAGFKEGDISITLEKNVLTISGERSVHAQEGDNAVTYIHQGISSRKFTRTFRLAEYVEVVGARSRDGILTIDLEKIIPEDKLPRKIDINY